MTYDQEEIEKIDATKTELSNLEVSEITELIGKTFVAVDIEDGELLFKQDNDNYIRFYHRQDCCETVDIVDVDSSLSLLENTPILRAEEIKKYEDYGYESYTWTFYTFATKYGVVTVMWRGISNGYYNEEVDIETKGTIK